MVRRGGAANGGGAGEEERETASWRRRSASREGPEMAAETLSVPPHASALQVRAICSPTHGAAAAGQGHTT